MFIMPLAPDETPDSLVLIGFNAIIECTKQGPALIQIQQKSKYAFALNWAYTAWGYAAECYKKKWRSQNRDYFEDLQCGTSKVIRVYRLSFGSQNPPRARIAIFQLTQVWS